MPTTCEAGSSKDQGGKQGVKGAKGLNREQKGAKGVKAFLY